jgi:hypothetical protein
MTMVFSVKKFGVFGIFHSSAGGSGFFPGPAASSCLI